MFLLTTTRCLPGWPLAYTAYHQEVEPPYRRCDRATVIRFHRRGIVVGRWTGAAPDETTAIHSALQLKFTGGVEAIGADGVLAPRFRKGADGAA
jgi:hypothetical protein